jgi:hypothetical protein
LGAMCSADSPTVIVPFGRVRFCGGSAGVAAPEPAVSETVPPEEMVEAAPVPESAAAVEVELVVQPAVQAKQVSTAAIARIGRRICDLPPSVGDSLFIYVLVLVMLPKNRGRSETGGAGFRPPDVYPLLTGVIVAT